MGKLFKRKSAPEPIDSAIAQNGADLAGVINKMSEQLVALEKKVDILISQCSGDRFQKSGQRFRRSEYNDRSRDRNFTKAICAECGQECQLPFKPSGDRPVYCRDCFAARKDAGSFKGKPGNSQGQGNFIHEKKSDKKRGSFFKRRRERS